MEVHASCGFSWAVTVNSAGCLQAGLLLSPVQCILSGDSGLSLQSCSPGDTLDEFRALVSTSQKAVPHHAVGKCSTRGPFPFVHIFGRQRAYFVIGRERTWAARRQRTNITHRHKDTHTLNPCSFIGRLSVWCRAARNSCVSSPARLLSKYQQRDRQCPLLSPRIWRNASTVTPAHMFSDGHAANSHQVPSSAPPQLARTSTLLLVNTFHSRQIPQCLPLADVAAT